jgi:hypothetical protein
MKEIAKRQTSETKRIKKILLFHSSHFLARSLTRRCFHGQQNSPLLALRVAPVLDSQRAIWKSSQRAVWIQKRSRTVARV